MKSTCECGIEPPGSIRHRVSEFSSINRRDLSTALAQKYFNNRNRYFSYDVTFAFVALQEFEKVLDPKKTKTMLNAPRTQFSRFIID